MMRSLKDIIVRYKFPAIALLTFYIRKLSDKQPTCDPTSTKRDPARGTSSEQPFGEGMPQGFVEIRGKHSWMTCHV